MTQYHLACECECSECVELREREQEERQAQQADDEPALCRTCHEPIRGNGDEDHDQCLECRHETP